MLSEFFQKIGLGEKEQTLYMTLAELGVQPASALARRIGIDRVVAYKHLKRMAEQGLLKIYVRDGVQHFGVTGAEGIEALLEERRTAIGDLEKQVPDIDAELKKVIRSDGFVPSVQIFEGKSGMKSLFRDLLYETKKENIIRIRMLTSNTFDQQMGAVSLEKFMGDFFRDARKQNLAIDIVEASGTLLPEYIRRIDPQHFDPDEFPAARGATNVFLAGTALYLACYGDSQIGLKLKQAQMSQIFHFFFDALTKNLPAADSKPPVEMKTWLR